MHHVFLSNIFLYLILYINFIYISLYTLNNFIVLLSYLIYISIPVGTICGRGQNIDQKYDQCIFLLDFAIYSVLCQVSWCKQTYSKQVAPTQYFTLSIIRHFKSASVLNIFRFWEPQAFMIYSLLKLP